jgi:uncharacterized membrane protein (DUF4010 family)
MRLLLARICLIRIGLPLASVLGFLFSSRGVISTFSERASAMGQPAATREARMIKTENSEPKRTMKMMA